MGGKFIGQYGNRKQETGNGDVDSNSYLPSSRTLSPYKRNNPRDIEVKQQELDAHLERITVGNRKEFEVVL